MFYFITLIYLKKNCIDSECLYFFIDISSKSAKNNRYHDSFLFLVDILSTRHFGLDVFFEVYLSSLNFFCLLLFVFFTMVILLKDLVTVGPESKIIQSMRFKSECPVSSGLEFRRLPPASLTGSRNSMSLS